MTTKLQEINPGRGLGQIKFGMTTDQVKAIIGEPDETETFAYESEEGEMSETWHYDELEISISFDEEENWRLVSIAISAPEATLKGQRLIGLEREELIERLETLEVGPLDFEDWSSAESPDHKLISAEKSELNFWLDEGELSEIQFGPLFDEEDNIQWPE